MTTVGLLGPAPTTTAGAVLSVALMLTAFLLLALVSAALERGVRPAREDP